MLKSRRKSIVISFSVVLSVFCSSLCLAANSGFVQRENDGLKLNGEAFYFSSANQYYLFYKPQSMVDEIFDNAKALGMRVFRTWGSCEGIDKETYYFQPGPGVYDERTFQKMDYIIYKANLSDIRLIIPLVNNWDDGFGGMSQYAAWAATAKEKITFDVYNPGGAASKVDIAISTGKDWVWYESLPHTLAPGWNYNVSFDLTSSTWKKAPDWAYTHPIGDLGQVKKLDIGFFGYSGTGSVCIDNIRVGPASNPLIWDGMEQIGRWMAQAGWSDATGLSIASDFVNQGSYSVRLNYDSSKSNGKAFVEINTNLGNHDLFYTDGNCRNMYKNYISYFLNRKNSITGVIYKDDPTIMMWELANEPRCETDPSGAVLQNWIDEIAGFIKNIDHNHLVSVGGEGWYNGLGTDFIRNNQSSFVDICSLHLLPNDNRMNEYDARAWIEQHVRDAKQTVGKPVYTGEYGWKVDREAARSKEYLLHDFTSSSEGWYKQWGYTGGPIRVSDPSFNGNGALKYSGTFGHGSTAGGAVWYAAPKDLSGYQYISLWVRTPAAPAGTWLELQLYTKSGANNVDTWSSTPVKGYLGPESWYQVKLAVSEMTAPADPAAVKSIGVQFKTFNASYSGDLYYDLAEAYTGSDINAVTAMAVRNRVYQEWADLFDTKNIDGAGFWLLSGHQPDGTLYPDYDHYTVYYPQDSQTASVMQDFSARMNNKRWVLHLQVPFYLAQRNYYTAAASAKMILDYIRKDTVLTQDRLYAYGTPYNDNHSITELDPQGMRRTLQNFAPAGYHLSLLSTLSVKDYMRDICHWLDFIFPEIGVVSYTPVAVPAYGSYSNWMVVTGAVASSDPMPDPKNSWYTPNFTVYGLWLSDPSSNGIGAQSYKTAAECENTYFRPVSLTPDRWTGQYVYVAEPPEIPSSANIAIAKPKITYTTKKLRYLEHLYEKQNSYSDPKLTGLFSYGGRALTEKQFRNFSWDKIIEPILMKNKELAEIYRLSIAGTPIKVKRIDRADSDYYLVPFYRNLAGNKKAASLVIIVDVKEGIFKELGWTANPVQYSLITEEEALVLALKYVKTLRGATAKGPITAELVWAPSLSSSPYYPVWRIKIGSKVIFVNQNRGIQSL